MKRILELYKKHREIINYIVFGGCTTLVSWATYALFVGGMDMEILAGKILSWICAVSFAFVTNKLWVFFSKAVDWKTWLREGVEFFASRAATGVVEVLGLPALMKLGLDASLFGVEGFAANIVVTVVVIILNYIVSKFLVFRKKNNE